MTNQATSKPTRKPWWGRVLFLMAVLVLAGAALLLGLDVARALLARADQQAAYARAREGAVATATALVQSQPNTSGAQHGLMMAAYTARIVGQDAPTPPPMAFATNTPPPATPAAVLPADFTPPPLPTIWNPQDAPQNPAAPTAIPPRVTPIDRQGNDLLNILLLGGDGEVTGEAIPNTDTMIVLSVNRTVGSVSMLSLPRDLYVYVPSAGMRRINTAYAWGEAVGYTDGGFGLLRETLFYNMGINVHFYAMVNLTQFAQIVDLLGGVEIGVDCALQDYYPVDDFDPARSIEENYTLRTLPVGYYQMQGDEALWYARSRRTSSDFDRGRRQQQLLRALYRKALAEGQLAALPELWNQGISMVDTNMGYGDMLSLLPIALRLQSSDIRSFYLQRTYHTTPWTTPDGSNVQLPVQDTLRQLLEEFYRPPVNSQLVVEGARIHIYNGTDTPNLDRVAADRLAWSGYSAIAMGPADRADYAATLLTDATGRSKGSSLQQVGRILSVAADNITIAPDPNREADFIVVLGSRYLQDACTFQGVLAVE